MKLSSIILENRFDQQAKKLEGELRDAHNQDNIVVSMGYFSEDGPKASKGFGKVTFRQKEEVDPSDWKNLKNFLQAKGLEVESEVIIMTTMETDIFFHMLNLNSIYNEVIKSNTRK